MCATRCIIIFACIIQKASLAQSPFLTTLESVWGSELFVCIGDSCRKVLEQRDKAFFNHEITTSPDGEYFGAIGRSRGFIVDRNGQSYVDHQLMMFADNGRLLHELPGIQRYSWSPNGQSIVCITGTDFEGFGFKADELIVVDMATWRQTVLESGTTYQDVFWAGFDSMIYATDHTRVFRIDPLNAKKAVTKYAGIYFSPDGRYYFSANYEGGTFSIFDRLTNRDITPMEYKGSPAVNFHRWLPQGSTLIFGDTFRDKQIFDVAAKTVRKKISGQILSYDDRRKEFIVLKEHRFFPEVPDKKVERIADGR